MMPLLVLVHGANHQRNCWDPTVEVLRELVPAGPILAVDLPGRGTNKVPATDISLGACVDSVVAEIDQRGAESVVLVGHSLGGVTAAGVAGRLGPSRVGHLVLVAATIPPEGQAVLDTFGLALRLTVPLVARRRKLATTTRSVAARSFCNGMTGAQRAFVLDNLCADAPWLVTEPVSRAGLAPEIERTWVLTTRDKAVPLAQQRRNIDNLDRLGGATGVVEIDSCHDVMVSEPTRLAEVIASCWSSPAASPI